MNEVEFGKKMDEANPTNLEEVPESNYVDESEDDEEDDDLYDDEEEDEDDEDEEDDEPGPKSELY